MPSCHRPRDARACLPLTPSHQAVGCTRSALSSRPSSTVHGVVFQIFCWTPPPTAATTPLRRVVPKKKPGLANETGRVVLRLARRSAAGARADHEAVVGVFGDL